MFEAQVTYYLNLYLGKYLHGLDAESLKISVWKGDVELRNLQLRTEALTELQLPITVKAGLLGRLTIKVSCRDSSSRPPSFFLILSDAQSPPCMQVPWAKLGREPIVVEFDRLYLLAGPPQYPTSSDALSTETVESYESSMDQLELEAKRKRVAEAELKWLEEQEARKSKASNASSSKAPAAQPQDESIAKTLGGRLQTMIEPILGNLQLKLSNVHVRYEEGDEDEMEGEGETPPDPSSASISAAAAPTSPDKARAIGVRGRRARAERRQRCVLGLMLGEVTAHTVDANGQRAFVVDHVLECLRKAVELSKLCAYFDVGPEYPLASSSSSIHTSSLDPSSKLGKKVQGGEKGPRSFIGASVKPPRSGCSWSEVTPGEWDALLLPALHYQERGGGSGGMPIKGASSALGGGGGGGGGGGRTQPSAVSSSSQEDAYRHDFILCPVSGGMKYTRRSPKFRASDEDAKQEAKLSLREVQLRLRCGILVPTFSNPSLVSLSPLSLLPLPLS